MSNRKNKNNKNNKNNSRRINEHPLDVNAKTIFENPTLCCQFLRDYVDIPLFKDLNPEDIQDVTTRYFTYFGKEYNSDTVKRIRIHEDGVESEIYVVSLIEHKSKVDYNVSVQLLKYMACIWAEYEKMYLRESQRKGISENKSFKYPPILPIVYYEGKDAWTADIHFKDRILFSELFADYIPDFRYILVGTRDYSNEELLSQQDEISLLMMINKIQSMEEYSDFLRLPSEEIRKIVKDSPHEIINIILAVMKTLCNRINITQKEQEECLEKVAQNDMGYLFENMERFDVQEERRKNAKERKQNEEERKQNEEERKQNEEERKQIKEERMKIAKERQQAQEERLQVQEERQQAKEERQQTQVAVQRAELAEKEILRLKAELAKYTK